MSKTTPFPVQPKPPQKAARPSPRVSLNEAPRFSQRLRSSPAHPPANRFPKYAPWPFQVGK